MDGLDLSMAEPNLDGCRVYKKFMVTFQSIIQASEALQGHIIRTALVPAYSLSNEQQEVKMKLETTQPVGAFKLRGAFNALTKLTQSEKECGVVCASTGNHGRAIAYASQKLGVKATVCMSSLVPDNKVQAIKRFGAEIRLHGNSQDEAQQLVDQLVTEQGKIEIPPFDHADVIAGQGTIGLEILEDWPEVDTILIGLSGGGLLSGIALAAKSINPDIQIIGISPQRGAAMAASLKAGKPVDVEEKMTLADSLGGGIGLQNAYTFELVEKLMDKSVLLSELQIASAMRHLFFNERLVTEGAGAVGAAVLIDESLKQQLKRSLGKHIAIVISGHNVDMNQFQQVIDQSHPVYS